MPLIKSKSEKAFKSNLRAEMKSGKPQKQAVAIAYNIRNKSKGMAHGGEACPTCGYAQGGEVKPSPSPSPSPISEEEAEKFRKGAGFYKGGVVDEAIEDDSQQTDLISADDDFLASTPDEDQDEDMEEKARKRVEKALRSRKAR